MNRLKAIHLNDSKIPFGGHKDRHELVGQGFLGMDMMRALLKAPHFRDIPFYLETPVESEAEYADEIRQCRALLDPKQELSP
jgi:deoxyribonuclease-4